ncbi:hypothetical protein FOZ61_010592 [Perkinsus olseni]|uniref:Uncharacterized protein n=1 Tax=Perkinsus olseni TaxID=32597 RepID=A0A7J6KXK4_PEROL|nr:hypothetical protein FOZ61_010592 [Perkinsus olseni]
MPSTKRGKKPRSWHTDKGNAKRKLDVLIDYTKAKIQKLERDIAEELPGGMCVALLERWCLLISQSGILQGPYGLWIRRSDISTAAAAAKKLSPEHWSWFQTNGVMCSSSKARDRADTRNNAIESAMVDEEKSRTSSLPVSTRTDVEHRRKRMEAVESTLKDLLAEQEYRDGQLDPVPQAILPPNPLEGAPAAGPTVEEAIEGGGSACCLPANGADSYSDHIATDALKINPHVDSEQSSSSLAHEVEAGYLFATAPLSPVSVLDYSPSRRLSIYGRLDEALSLFRKRNRTPYYLLLRAIVERKSRKRFTEGRLLQVVFAAKGLLDLGWIEEKCTMNSKGASSLRQLVVIQKDPSGLAVAERGSSEEALKRVAIVEGKLKQLLTTRVGPRRRTKEFVSDLPSQIPQAQLPPNPFETLSSSRTDHADIVPEVPSSALNINQPTTTSVSIAVPTSDENAEEDASTVEEEQVTGEISVQGLPLAGVLDAEERLRRAAVVQRALDDLRNAQGRSVKDPKESAERQVDTAQQVSDAAPGLELDRSPPRLEAHNLSTNFPKCPAQLVLVEGLSATHLIMAECGSLSTEDGVHWGVWWPSSHKCLVVERSEDQCRVIFEWRGTRTHRSLWASACKRFGALVKPGERGDLAAAECRELRRAMRDETASTSRSVLPLWGSRTRQTKLWGFE